MSRTFIKNNGDGTGHLILGSFKLRDVRFGRKPAKKKPRKEWKFSIEMLRVREIENLVRHRFGGAIPNPDGTDDRDTCLDFVRAVALALNGQDIAAWCRVFAPWATDADIVPIMAEASKRKKMMRADGVAGLLLVTMAERLALNFKTIGATDMTIAQRKKFMKNRKREMDRKRDEQKRRAAGTKDRASYVASSLSTMKPWEALNMSRRTWYRKGKPSVGTSPSRIEVIGKSEEPVPQGQPPSPQPFHQPLPVAEGERSAGLGKHCPAELQEAAPHGNDEATNADPEIRRNAA